MKSTLRLITPLVFILAAAACGPVSEKETEEPTWTEFRLVNGGGSSIFLIDPVPVTVLADGERYDVGCTNSQTPAMEDGGVVATRLEIRPGDHQSASMKAERSDTDGCRKLGDFAGETLEAKFCWFRNIAGVRAENGTALDEECTTTTFVVGEDELVEVKPDTTIEPSAQTMSIVLENATDAPIYVQTARNCGSDRYYDVSFGDERVFPTSVCGLCDCGESPCGVGCAAACEADSVEEIAPGSERTVDMPMVYPRRYDGGDQQCTQRQLVPRGPLTATLCHGTEMDETVDGATVTDETCEEIEFTLDESEVRLRVE
jgi:hypothetical protein